MDKSSMEGFKQKAISLGKIGEDIACRYLKRQGCRILERNCRMKFGELDVVAKGKDGTLLFIEVKTMQVNGNLIPEDNATFTKLTKVRRCAQAYANTHEHYIDEEKGYRIDLITIAVPGETHNPDDFERTCTIKVYENV